MSALLGHAKAFRALARAFEARAPFARYPEAFEEEATVYHFAADALEQQARDECTGNPERAK